MNNFNFKTIIDYLRKKIETPSFNVKKEYVYAALACLVIIYIISAMDTTSNKIEQSEGTSENTTAAEPLDNTQTSFETLSLRDVALESGIPLDEVTDELLKKKFKLNSADDTIEQIAKDNRTSSKKLLHLLESYQTRSKGSQKKSENPLDEITLEELCEQKDLPLDEILARFDMLGAKVDPKDKMKQIAKYLGVNHSELINIIEGKTQ